MDLRRTRTCERCKTAVPLDQVRIVPKNNETNLLVCDNCMSEIKKATADGRIAGAQSRIYAPIDSFKPRVTNVPQDSPFRAMSSQRISPLPPPDYAKYTCTKCNYVFKVDRSKAGITYGVKCPYCGRVDKLRLYRG
ncbi:hypothetical protein HZC30_00865 [Candidatus Woesearchaeota archaeon]|nr:hypothetical protein [Candidatus Woesearchaeota archaeon]